MKTADAIYTAAVFLQLDELCDGMNAEDFTATDPSLTLGEEQARELDILLRCCNLVLRELCESEFPIKGRVQIDTDGTIPYTHLPPRVTHIYDVRQHGKRVPFREWHDCITLPVAGKVTVAYAASPAQATLAGASPYPTDTPSARLIAYGIAREYCLISGMAEEASIWDNRFAACAQEEATPRGEKRVKPRVWR